MKFSENSEIFQRFIQYKNKTIVFFFFILDWVKEFSGGKIKIYIMLSNFVH